MTIKKHWYCFTYAAAGMQASTYTGYEKKGVTMQMIDENKKNAGVPQESVLLACIHLGYMTKDEFTGA